MKRTLYTLDPKRPLGQTAVGFFTLSALLRLAWALAFTGAARARGLALHVLLPELACAAFIVLLVSQGKKRLWPTFFPMLLGVAFFILKALGFTPVHQALCTALYLAVAALYGAAVWGLAPLRPLLIPLFALPLAYHILVEDLFFNRPVYTLNEWLQEWSVLCIMAGLLCVSLGMEKNP